MTNREKEIYDLIRENPMITQQEIADQLGIQRSSVAVHILNLSRKGMILGKGYILKEGAYALVIGGANVDIIGFPSQVLNMEDSNPGKIKMSMGGVGRNIAENLSRLGITTKMLTAIGNDVYGKKILEEARMVDLDLSKALVLDHYSTSIYMSILDDAGDMKLAMSDMDITDQISVDYLSKYGKLIAGATVVVLDTNLSRAVLEYLMSNFPNTAFFVDTVSAAKSEKIKGLLGHIHTLKPNRIEAEQMTGVKVNTVEDAKIALQRFQELGVKRTYISLGTQGIVWGDGVETGVYHPTQVEMVNATGAGDAFMAGLVYGFMEGFETETAIAFAASASALAVQSEETINPELSQARVLNYMKEE